jgi:aminoglycoside phosphotransferase (APT) family kinase protein
MSDAPDGATGHSSSCQADPVTGNDVPIDRPTVGDPAAALVRWASERFGDAVTLAEPSTTRGEGFDSEIHLVHLAGPSLPPDWSQPLVLRILPTPDRLADAHREAAIQDRVADLGYPAPRILHVFAPGELTDRPAQVMQRAPGALLLDDLLRRPWTARRLVRRLAELQVRLHALPTDDLPDTDDLLDRRLRLPRNVASDGAHPELGRALDQIEALAPRLRDAPRSICHGDFHPLNVLSDGGSATVIDWTDAGLGDRHGDLARTLLLFDMAAIAATNPAERVVLAGVGPVLGRIHRRGYAATTSIDDRRLRLWEPVHLIHSWAQASVGHERVAAGMAEALQQRFEAALAAVDDPP